MFAREIQKSPRGSMYRDGPRHHFFLAFRAIHCSVVRHENHLATISATASIRENPRHLQFFLISHPIIPPLPA
jgi:hypothetical protein